MRSTNHAAAVIDRKARYSLRIEILAYPSPAFEAPVRGGGFRRNIAMPFGTEKQEWWGLPNGEKILVCLFVLTQLTNVTDGRADRHRMTAKTAWQKLVKFTVLQTSNQIE